MFFFTGPQKIVGTTTWPHNALQKYISGSTRLSASFDVSISSLALSAKEFMAKLCKPLQWLLRSLQSHYKCQIAKRINLDIKTDRNGFVTIKRWLQSSFHFFEMHYQLLLIIFLSREKIAYWCIKTSPKLPNLAVIIVLIKDINYILHCTSSLEQGYWRGFMLKLEYIKVQWRVCQCLQP